MSKIFENQPTNINYLSPVGFRFNVEYLPNTNWFITSVNLPGISLGEAVQPTPLMPTYVPGNDIAFDPLTVTFLVDEDLQNWRELFDWMMGIGFPNDYDEYKAQKALQIYSDASLSILNSNMNVNYVIKFEDLHPTSLSEIQFDSGSSDVEPPTATITFRYLHYSYEKI